MYNTGRRTRSLGDMKGEGAAGCASGVGVLAGVEHGSLCWGIWRALKGVSRRI